MQSSKPYLLQLLTCEKDEERNLSEDLKPADLTDQEMNNDRFYSGSAVLKQRGSESVKEDGESLKEDSESESHAGSSSSFNSTCHNLVSNLNRSSFTMLSCPFCDFPVQDQNTAEIHLMEQHKVRKEKLTVVMHCLMKPNDSLGTDMKLIRTGSSASNTFYTQTLEEVSGNDNSQKVRIPSRGDKSHCPPQYNLETFTKPDQILKNRSNLKQESVFLPPQSLSYTHSDNMSLFQGNHIYPDALRNNLNKMHVSTLDTFNSNINYYQCDTNRASSSFKTENKVIETSAENRMKSSRHSETYDVTKNKVPHSKAEDDQAHQFQESMRGIKRKIPQTSQEDIRSATVPDLTGENIPNLRMFLQNSKINSVVEGEKLAEGHCFKPNNEVISHGNLATDTALKAQNFSQEKALTHKNEIRNTEGKFAPNLINPPAIFQMGVHQQHYMNMVYLMNPALRHYMNMNVNANLPFSVANRTLPSVGLPVMQPFMAPNICPPRSALSQLASFAQQPFTHKEKKSTRSRRSAITSTQEEILRSYLKKNCSKLTPAQSKALSQVTGLEESTIHKWYQDTLSGNRQIYGNSKPKFPYPPPTYHTNKWVKSSERKSASKEMGNVQVSSFNTGKEIPIVMDKSNTTLSGNKFSGAETEISQPLDFSMKVQPLRENCDASITPSVITSKSDTASVPVFSSALSENLNTSVSEAVFSNSVTSEKVGMMSQGCPASIAESTAASTNLLHFNDMESDFQSNSKKPVSVFKSWQTEYLWQQYKQSIYPSGSTIKAIAIKLRVTENSIQDWFQYARKKENESGLNFGQILNNVCPFCLSHYRDRFVLKAHLETDHTHLYKKDLIDELFIEIQQRTTSEQSQASPSQIHGLPEENSFVKSNSGGSEKALPSFNMLNCNTSEDEMKNLDSKRSQIEKQILNNICPFCLCQLDHIFVLKTHLETDHTKLYEESFIGDLFIEMQERTSPKMPQVTSPPTPVLLGSSFVEAKSECSEETLPLFKMENSKINFSDDKASSECSDESLPSFNKVNSKNFSVDKMKSSDGYLIQTEKEILGNICPFCPSHFKDKYILKAHLETDHSNFYHEGFIDDHHIKMQRTSPDLSHAQSPLTPVLPAENSCVKANSECSEETSASFSLKNTESNVSEDKTKCSGEKSIQAENKILKNICPFCLSHFKDIFVLKDHLETCHANLYDEGLIDDLCLEMQGKYSPELSQPLTCVLPGEDTSIKVNSDCTEETLPSCNALNCENIRDNKMKDFDGTAIQTKKQILNNVCPSCALHFRNKFALMKHLETHHNNPCINMQESNSSSASSSLTHAVLGDHSFAQVNAECPQKTLQSENKIKSSDRNLSVLSCNSPSEVDINLTIGNVEITRMKDSLSASSMSWGSTSNNEASNIDTCSDSDDDALQIDCEWEESDQPMNEINEAFSSVTNNATDSTDLLPTRPPECNKL